MSNLAVVVTCHAAHLKWLPEALASIDRQVPAAAERIIAFDRCPAPPTLGQHWRAIHGEWGHPAPARDAALQATASPWVIFWDADNVMPDGYLAAAQNATLSAGTDLAIFYPDIQYCDEHLRLLQLLRVPEWDYWEMRGENYIDTASVWRREALELVGGWGAFPSRTFEDFALALNITGAGWKAARLNSPPILMRVHSGSRTQSREHSGGTLSDLWYIRSLAIVSLLAGREGLFERWRHFLMNAELPPKTALYVIDNSRKPEFTRSAYEACLQIAAARGLTHLDFSISTLAYPAGASGAEPVLPAALRQRHMHVARLYTGLLPRVSEDLILTLEDDVEPPLDAVRRLGEEIGWTRRGKIGAVAGAYPMAEHPTLVCAGNGKDQWGPAIPWSQLPAGLMDVGCVGGGCTMWANWAIKRNPVNFWWDQHLGWDASLSIQIRRRGYRVRLHGGVRCQHHAHGRIGPAPTGASPMIISPTSASLAGAAPAGILPTGGSRAGVSSIGISPSSSWPAGPMYRKQPEGEKVLPPAHHSSFWTIGGLPGRNDASPSRPVHLNADSWIPEAELGLRIPPYQPTYDFPTFINERHQALSACPVEAPGTITLGISGWLRREDALKLYEMAYFSAGNILELGCFQGLSTAILARAVRDSAESKSIVSVDFVANHTYIAQRSLADRGLAGLASFLTGDAGEVCQRLVRENRRFSFIFIDHSHRYEDVVRVCRLLPDLLTGEGFCLFHDYNDGRNANPQDENYGVFRAVADTMPPDRFAFYGIYGCAALYRLCP